VEQNIALLMADLSGYTAMTETHGAHSAADLIDKYISLVRQCLVGNSRLHERTGDEIMIVSNSADDILATAVMIHGRTSKEEHFLQVHGGMHFGEVLKRNNYFFGSAINLAARITSKATAGSFWCSKDFVSVLSDKSKYRLESKGFHSFKNIKKEGEIFELITGDNPRYFTDPVCRMLIVDTKKAIPHASKPGIYFCSAQCSHIYSDNH
jgi:adenylate cyclase